MNKLKSFGLPTWFPYLSSWLKAFVTAASVFIILSFIEIFLTREYLWEKLGKSWEILICLTIVFLLSLIPLIAFAHHFLHLFFHIVREAILHTYGYNLFWFPELRSWWKALYSWLVIMISTFTAILVYTLILPWFDLSYKAAIFNKVNFLSLQTFPEKLLFFVFISIWIIVAAKLYQFEFLCKTFFQLVPTTARSKKKKPRFRKSSAPQVQKIQNKHQNKKNNSQKIKPQTNLNKKGNELAIYSSNYGVDRITKTHIIPNINQQKYSYKNYIIKLQKFLKQNYLIYLIIPLIGLVMHGLFRGQLISDTPVVIVTDIPSPIEKKLNSKELEIEQTTNKLNTAPAPIPITESSPISSGTLVLPPPDPFKLAVNRAMNAAEMAQSAQSQLEWEAVASQWQDAMELMKIVPVNHPKYTLARKKIREYQRYYEYAQRVSKISAQ